MRADQSSFPLGRAGARPALALVALSALFFQITAATFTSLGVVLPAMVAELRWSWSDAGLGFTLLAVACGLASLAPAAVMRTLGVRATLAGGGAVLAAGLALVATAHHPARYLVGETLAGVGFALAAIIPGAFVIARSFAQPSWPLGLYFTAGGLGGAAGPLLGRLGVEHAWRGYWWAMAAVSLALALLAAAAVDPRWTRDRPDAAGARDPVEGWSVRAALLTPAFWVITAAYTVYLLCGVTVNFASVRHLGERGVPAGAAAALLAAENLVNAGARAAGGALGARVHPRTLVLAALTLLIAGLAALATTRGGWTAWVYALGVGGGYGLSYLATAVLLLRWFGPRRNLELFSVMALVSTLAAVGPWAAGLVHDRAGGFAPALWAGAALAGCALAAMAVVRAPGAAGRT
jgi:cyanate permease